MSWSNWRRDHSESELYLHIWSDDRNKNSSFTHSPEVLIITSTLLKKLRRTQTSDQTEKTPRPHQEEAIRSVVAGLKTQDRGQPWWHVALVRRWPPYGSGKDWEQGGLSSSCLSWTSCPDSAWMDCWEQRGPKLDLCLLRSNCCQADQGFDEWVVNTSELGIPVSNDPEDIKAFLKQYPDGVVFSTYQSSMLIRDAQRDLEIPSFDLAIADEAHRCAGRYRSLMGAFWMVRTYGQTNDYSWLRHPVSFQVELRSGQEMRILKLLVWMTHQYLVMSFLNWVSRRQLRGNSSVIKGCNHRRWRPNSASKYFRQSWNFNNIKQGCWCSRVCKSYCSPRQ